MARRNQKQRKTVPASRAQPARGQATTDSNSTIHTCAEDICKDSAGGNAAIKAKIPTEDKKTRGHLVPSSVSFNMENLKPRDEERPSYLCSNTPALSDSGFREVVHHTSSTQASQALASTSEASSAPAADAEGERAGQLEDVKEYAIPGGEAASRNRANESGVANDQEGTNDLEGAHAEAGSDPVVAKESENTPLGRGQRHKKPSLRGQGAAAQAAQKEAERKKKASVPINKPGMQQTRKRKRENDELEGTRRGKRKEKRNADARTSTEANDCSLKILFAVAVANYFEVYERPELREAAAQGLLALSEKAIVSA